MPGYTVEFKERQAFGKLLVARHLTSGSSPETLWEAHVTELSPIAVPDETLFAAPENTPVAQRFWLVQVSEQDARQAFKSLPAIVWPAVRQGKTSGVITVYVSLDKNGKVRETWPLSSDNPEISDVACKQIRGWTLANVQPNGTFRQLETLFTFSFQTPPIGSDGKTQP
jgi:hypothetical protein